MRSDVDSLSRSARFHVGLLTADEILFQRSPVADAEVAQLAHVVCKVPVSVYARPVHANEVDQTLGQEAGPVLYYRGVAAFMNTKNLDGERVHESVAGLCQKRQRRTIGERKVRIAQRWRKKRSNAASIYERAKVLTL